MTIIINMEDPYSKREIDSFMRDIKEQLDRIEEQTTRHNGRMKTNELNIATVNTKINTTIAVAGTLLPIILALGGMIFYMELEATKDKIPGYVTEAVYKALDSYQFEVIDPMIK